VGRDHGGIGPSDDNSGKCTRMRDSAGGGAGQRETQMRWPVEVRAAAAVLGSSAGQSPPEPCLSTTAVVASRFYLEFGRENGTFLV
jgi:hypothetical protein